MTLGVMKLDAECQYAECAEDLYAVWYYAEYRLSINLKNSCLADLSGVPMT